LVFGKLRNMPLAQTAIESMIHFAVNEDTEVQEERRKMEENITCKT
jgi:hypothetical protein